MHFREFFFLYPFLETSGCLIEAGSLIFVYLFLGKFVAGYISMVSWIGRTDYGNSANTDRMSRFVLDILQHESQL